MIYTRVQPLKDGYSLLKINPRLCLIYRALKRPGREGRKDRIQCAYFGFETVEAAATFRNYLITKHKCRAVVREPERLSEVAWEVKVWEFDGLLLLVRDCVAKSGDVRSERHAAA